MHDPAVDRGHHLFCSQIVESMLFVDSTMYDMMHGSIDIDHLFAEHSWCILILVGQRAGVNFDLTRVIRDVKNCSFEWIKDLLNMTIP